MRFLSSKILLLSCVALILIVGAYLRLYKIGEYLTFLGDEGRDVLIVKRMIVDHDFVLLGPTASVGGFFLGPMYYYFMAPFLWVWHLDPVGPAVMVALFGIGTIYLVYHVGKSFFHPFVGVIAASLYALSPVVIAYSRSSWNPNLVPFFSLLLIFLLWRYALKKNDKDLIAIGLIWGLGIQFHYLFSFLIVFSILWVIGVEKSFRAIRQILFMGIGSVVTFSPFIVFEFRHGFPNVISLFNFFHTGNETGFTGNGFVAIVSDITFRSIGRLLYRMPNYELWNGFPEWQMTLLVIVIRTTIIISLALLTVLGVYAFIHKGQKLRTILNEHFGQTTEQRTGAILLLLWFVFSILLFGFYKRGIYDYYFGIFFAFPFLALAVVFREMMRNKVGITIAVLLWGTLLWYNWQGRPFIYPPNKQLEQTKIIARKVIDMTQGQPYNFALITATNSDQAYRYFLEIFGRKPVTIEQPPIDPERKSVTDQLIAMCENPDCHPLGNSQWEVAGFGRAEVVESTYVFPVTIYRLVHYSEKK